ncbi:sugar phosphate nucleotidyltransferase [Pseudomonas fulva]|uniref:sugar phosphate nucleotidyltransferase n=1 Tax=Pseudomonas fulva TaxID=47880 RepID=UPI003D2EA8CF
MSFPRTLLLARLRNIVIIFILQGFPHYEQWLIEGSQWSLNLSCAVQPSRYGIARAFTIGDRLVGYDRSALLLDGPDHEATVASHPLIKPNITNLELGRRCAIPVR